MTIELTTENVKTYNQELIRHESFINKDIKHLEQHTHNDCGVACFKMAILYVFRNQTEDVRLEVFKRLESILKDLDVKDYSLWTIDIAHICSIKGIKHAMYTITFGVQDSYAQEDFYSSERDFDTEKHRVNQKFLNHKILGINVSKKSLSLNEIKTELCNSRCVCIILVDANLLHGMNRDTDEDDISVDYLDRKATNSCCLNLTNPLYGSQTTNDLHSSVEIDLVNQAHNYCGHFIVLIGYDDNRQIVFYRNPASSKNLSITSYANFEKARKSYGTDEDVLFIYS